MKFVLSFLLLFSVHAKAQQWNPMCPGTTTGWVNSLLLKMSKEDQHPYVEVCEPVDFEKGLELSAKSNAERIPQNVFMRNIPEKTKSGKPLKPFFQDVKKNIQKRIADERKKMKAAKECLKTGDADKCFPISTETRQAVAEDCGFEKLGNTYRCEMGLDEASPTYNEEALACTQERLECSKRNLTATRNYSFGRLVKDARINLILSTPAGGLLGKTPVNPGVLNVSMREHGVYKAKPWDTSVGQEAKVAREILGNYFKIATDSFKNQKTPFLPKVKELAIGAAAAGPAGLVSYAKDTWENLPPSTKTKIDSSVSAIKHNHLALYTSLLALNPVLQFIESREPDKKEVEGAVDQMLASLDKEENWLKETTESLDSDGPLDNDLLKLLSYRSEVSSVLAKKNEFCGISRDLKQVAEARSIGKDIAISAPILLGSMFLPVVSAPTRLLLGGALGAGGIIGSGVMVAERQIEVNEAEYLVVGRFNPKSEKDLVELSERMTERQTEMYLGALGVADIKVAAKAYKTMARFHRMQKFKSTNGMIRTLPGK